jgi:predicted phosphoadenosine phosphosulfate sulfurtransferase
MKKPILLSWSGGKDSALALHALRFPPRPSSAYNLKGKEGAL